MDNPNLIEVLALATVLSVFVLAGVEFVKRVANVPVNILPLIGLLIGVAIGWAASPFTELELTLRLWAGALAGLSATGLFELAFKNRPGTTKDE